MKLALINNELVEFDRASIGRLDSDKDKEKYKHLEYIGYGIIASIDGREQNSECKWHLWILK